MFQLQLPIREIVKRRLLCLLIFVSGLMAQTTGSSPFKISPVSLTFVQITTATTIPTAQTITITTTSGSTSNATGVTVAPPISQWLTVTPLSGMLPASIKVAVNPTSLPVGTYNETLIITPNGTNPAPINVLVSLQVKSPPSDITISSDTLAFTYRLGDNAPASQLINLGTTGGLLSWSAATAGAAWLSVPVKTGVIFPGFTSALSVNISPDNLIPGTYKGTLTISAADAVSKTKIVIVTLVIQPGVPAIHTTFPAQLPEGSSDSTLTMNGLRFYKDTVFRATGTIVKSNVLGPNAATITIPARLLTTAGAVTIIASNANPGGGDSSTYRMIISHGGPIVAAVLNAASYSANAIAPGTILTIFGSGLGSPILTVFDNTQPVVDTALSGTRVLFSGAPLPVLYASANQVSAIVPYQTPPLTAATIQVEFNGIQSPTVPIIIQPTAPGVFTTTGTGMGQLAAFTLDEATGALVLNNDKNAAAKGQILIFYATGEGLSGPPPVDGRIAIQPALSPNPALTVEIGGAPAEVLYSGPSPGLVNGLIQINARIPGSALSGKAAPVVLRIAEGKSQDATINLK